MEIRMNERPELRDGASVLDLAEEYVSLKGEVTRLQRSLQAAQQELIRAHEDRDHAIAERRRAESTLNGIESDWRKAKQDRDRAWNQLKGYGTAKTLVGVLAVTSAALVMLIALICWVG